MTFALYFGSRGLFPEALTASARAEVRAAAERHGFRALLPDGNAARCGAVETAAEGHICAKRLIDRMGEHDGAILSPPSFGDKNAAMQRFVTSASR